MPEIKVPNLCGASPEFNAVFEKFDNMMADAVAGLESSASSLAGDLGTAVTSLETDLRVLVPEIPSLPPKNLQALLTSLTSLTEGTSQYITLFAEIKTDFETELTAAGKDLNTLVTDAFAAVQGGGDLCSICPNFEKAADGLTAAVEKANNSPQPLVDSLEEKTSTLVKNAEVALQNSNLKDRVEKFATEISTAVDVVTGTITSTTPPTEDKGAFTVTDTTRGFGFEANTIDVTTPTDQGGKNITTGGFTSCQSFTTERFKDSDVTQSGDTWIVKLAHKPRDISILTGNSLITRSAGSIHQSTPTTEEIQMFVEIAKKGEHIDYSTSHHTATSAYYEVDEQTVTITGRGQNFFPHTSTHKTYFDENKKDVEFEISYFYFANYDCSRVETR